MGNVSELSKSKEPPIPRPHTREGFVTVPHQQRSPQRLEDKKPPDDDADSQHGNRNRLPNMSSDASGAEFTRSITPPAEGTELPQAASPSPSPEPHAQRSQSTTAPSVLPSPSLQPPARRSRSAVSRGSVMKSPTLKTPLRRRPTTQGNLLQDESVDEVEALESSRSGLGLQLASHRGSFFGKMAQAPSGTSGGFDTILHLSKKHSIALSEVKAALEEYRELDVDASGTLSFDEFAGVVRKRCNIPEDKPVPSSLTVLALGQADNDGDGHITFEEFLLWCTQCSFVEEMVVTDASERHMRKLARDNDIDVMRVEALKRRFAKFDTDGSGFIEWPEFKAVLCDILEVKEALDVSDSMLRRYWTEADSSCAKKLSFDDFVGWYSHAPYSRLRDASLNK